MDRKTLTSVYDEWQASIHAAALRDYYHAASKNLLLLFDDMPTNVSLASLLSTNADLKS